MAYTAPIAAASWEVGARPRPIGLTASQQAAEIRDQLHAWHVRSTGKVPPPGTTFRDRIAGLWFGDEA